jgi:enoyl-CoA hydratase/carnithine racemase
MNHLEAMEGINSVQDSNQNTEPQVLIEHGNRMMSIILNRPLSLNSLTTEMIRLIGQALDQAEREENIGFVLFRGAGEKGFCAGADLKMLARAARSRQFEEAYEFFDAEYALDLRLFRFPKPVVVIGDGITMGGGLGLSAGADVVIGTERTRMAMPESRIGLFPDVGATAWLFKKCPEGYPEFLALTGYEPIGTECVRLGLATHICSSDNLPEVFKKLDGYSHCLPPQRNEAAKALSRHISAYLSIQSSPNPEMDEWVGAYFHAQDCIPRIIEALSKCQSERQLCSIFFSELKERSPTSLTLTLHLLQHNRSLPMEEVYAVESRAARFMVEHHDFTEGVRARLLDKDDDPQWRPRKIEDVDLSSILPRIFADRGFQMGEQG